MSFFQIEGQVTATGSSQHNLHGRYYSYVEVLEPNGRRVTIEKVFVTTQTDAYLAVGTNGVFYFEKVMGILTSGPKHLWGVKCTNGEVHFDGTNFRFYMALRIMFIGIVLSVIFIGIPIALVGFGQLIISLATLTRREQMFYGPDGEERQRLQAREAVRI
ncbi:MULTISPECIES: hypothetical protein [Afipia]|uniref:Uncharacterized protein n=2 Tax=Afipia felis TaxID=1035 RepID=A0A380WAS6_AFIFE|nr:MULTISPECIES: hypothetical protein [Afipia]EFI51327.1 hypothetical protein AfiDRAFT_2700 [Afipia sp. 1NLS2]EKS29230.1 hypothetical protein HMPREF9697_01758 [Afipia felis ATCC 53690]SUU77937.1 Uncharacterised protein [Afipia felis]SUU86002.1 Uncharacterised protein [Afipia felis]